MLSSGELSRQSSAQLTHGEWYIFGVDESLQQRVGHVSELVHPTVIRKLAGAKVPADQLRPNLTWRVAGSFGASIFLSGSAKCDRLLNGAKDADAIRAFWRDERTASTRAGLRNPACLLLHCDMQAAKLANWHAGDDSE